MQNSMIHCICFRLEVPFSSKFGSKNDNFQFQLNFGIYSNSNMENSMVRDVHSFFFSTEVSFLWQSFSKKSKLFVEAETWSLD